jgi:excisionase family DNA binding protein
MANQNQAEWLSLSGVAEKLGVHPSTVRLWSDKGVLPTHRTSGGHRRYLLHEVELWMNTAREKQVVEPTDALQNAIGKIRMRVSEGQLEAEAWYGKLDADARAQYRMSGGALVRGLIGYLSRETGDENSEATALGYEYASRARRYGLNSVDATQAFLFFRNSLLEALVNAYEDARVPPGLAWGRLLTRLHHFTDRVLVSLLESYQSFEERSR